MQIDVGFGDLIHPGAVQADYPALLDLPAPSLRVYPPETVIAEKAEAVVYLGNLNSRMKDFYDIWRLSQQFDRHRIFRCLLLPDYRRYCIAAAAICVAAQSR